MKVCKTLILKYKELPKKIQESVRDHCGFGNDCYISIASEFEPCGKETWKDELTWEAIEAYHKGQVEHNNYKGTLKDFIKDYGLQVEEWILNQKIDLEGVEEILIKICW